MAVKNLQKHNDVCDTCNYFKDQPNAESLKGCESMRAGYCKLSGDFIQLIWNDRITIERVGCASYSNSLNNVTECTKADIEKIITMLETCVISKNWDANIGVGPGDYAFGDIRIPTNKVKAFCNALRTINFNRNIETILKLPTTCNAADWTHEETMNRLQCTYDRGFEEGSSNVYMDILPNDKELEAIKQAVCHAIVDRIDGFELADDYYHKLKNLKNQEDIK